MSIPVWALALVLVGALFLIYAPSFTMDYLTLDEVAAIGNRHLPSYYFYALAHGRPLCFFRPLVYAFAGYDPARVQFVRFLSFVAMAGMAVILFTFLRRQSGRPLLAFFTTLFLFSQLTFQTISAFSLDLIAFYVQPIAWSLGAFWAHFYFFPRRRTRRWKANLIVFLLLFAAMQAGQTWAFFAMVPLSFLVLNGGRERLSKALAFVVLAAGVTAVSFVAYRIELAILHAHGETGHGGGEATVESVTSNPLALLSLALSPTTYWSAFKLWNYPYPFHNLSASTSRRQLMAFVVMVGWLALVVTALATELRRSGSDRKLVVGKWLVAGVCLALGGSVLLADSTSILHAVDPGAWSRESRPHLTMVMSGVCIFTGVYALLTLSSRFEILRTRLAKGIGIAAVTMTAFGAQSGLLRNYVDNHDDQLDFIRTELCSKSPEDFDRVVVVLPPRISIAISEPADRFSGQVTFRRFHERRPERYQYAMRSLGMPLEGKQFAFVEDYSEHNDRDLVIDWRKYFAAKQRYMQALRAR